MNAFVLNMIRKLSSRKLWMAIAVVGTGISVALGNEASDIQTVAGIVSAVIGSVTYIVTEGKIDAANVGVIIQGAEEIKNAGNKGEYAYIFDTLEKMAEVLSVKTNLGNRTRNAYKKNDKNELKKIASDYDVVIKKLEEFHALLQKQWFIDNKPYGFDIQDIRFGGLILRIKSCRDRLISYIEGTISEIPELSEEILEKDCCWSWGRSVSPNTISHIL